MKIREIHVIGKNGSEANKTSVESSFQLGILRRCKSSNGVEKMFVFLAHLEPFYRHLVIWRVRLPI